MGKLPLLTPREVRANLTKLGFTHKRTDGSHETWQRPADAAHIRAVVTVDAAESRFGPWLMTKMIGQSKLTKEEFCSGQLKNSPAPEAAKVPKERNENA
jgi:predicted RNA binding protein YcfA (HicA-like mRNA interferase family)